MPDCARTPEIRAAGKAIAKSKMKSANKRNLIIDWLLIKEFSVFGFQFFIPSGRRY
jgi:hypothetical protein